VQKLRPELWQKKELDVRLKLKLKGRHFYRTEVIEAEWQAVLNTLTEHDLL
jgi:hypothetical protein